MREFIRPIRPAASTVHRAPAAFRSSDAPPVLPVLRELSPKPADTIVELGSGEGHFAVPIAGRLAAAPGGGVVIAVDSSRIFTRRLGREAAMRGLDDHLRAVSMDGAAPNTLPLPSDSADAIFAVNTLQYMADPLPYLKEAARALNPLGTLLIADWQRSANGKKRTRFSASHRRSSGRCWTRRASMPTFRSAWTDTPGPCVP